MDKRHVQLPNDIGDSDITPRDKLVYLSIRRFMDKNTKIAYPSYAKISEITGISINTIRLSIKSLEENDYFKILKEGRKQKYLFNELKAFEPFSYDFLDNTDLTYLEKSALIALQQRMFTDIVGIGKISYSNRELARQIKMPESTLSKVNRSLLEKGYLSIIKNESRDLETGCKTDTKIYHLNKLGQAVIWTLKKHEDRINKNTEDIQEIKKELEQLKKSNAEKDKLIDKLLKDTKIEKSEYIL